MDFAPIPFCTTRKETETMKHFTILNRQQLVEAAYGKGKVPSAYVMSEIGRLPPPKPKPVEEASDAALEVVEPDYRGRLTHFSQL
jgi:hypothetical protein